MVAVYDPNLRVTEQGTGDNPNTWGQILNGQVFALLCNAISGVTQIDFSAGANIDISTSALVPPNNNPGVANGAVDTARMMTLELTSTTTPLTSGLTLTLPALQKLYFINAMQTGNFPITIMCKGGSQSLVFNAGQRAMIYTNGIKIYSQEDTRDLLAANNLSDLTSASTARTNLGLGTSATINVGTSPNQIVQLNSSAQLPALDGSLLTNVTGTPTGVGSAAYLNVGTTAGNIPQLNGSAQLPAVDGSLLTNLPTPTGTPVVTLASNWKIVIGAITIQGGPCTTSPGGLTVTFGTAFSGTPLMVWGADPLGATVWPSGYWTSANALGQGGNGSGGSEAGFFMAIGPT